MPVILTRFDDANPLEYDKLNENFQSLVSAINALTGSNVVQLGAVLDDSAKYMPKAGGTFLGQIKAPSILIGDHAVVSRNDTATTALAGVVKATTTLNDITASISNPPTQAEVNAIKTAVNALLAALRVAGVVSS